MKKVYVYCDGSSLGNGTGDARAAAAAVLEYRRFNVLSDGSDGNDLGTDSGPTAVEAAAVLDYQVHRKIVGQYLGNSTNQQAEIVSACIGLEALKESCEVEILSDSQYVINTMSGKFKRKTNLDLWRRLDEAAQRHQVTWTWVRGHAGDPVQKISDQAARLIAETGNVDQHRLDQLLIKLNR